jgi:hypothetical protein
MSNASNVGSELIREVRPRSRKVTTKQARGGCGMPREPCHDPSPASEGLLDVVLCSPTGVFWP